MARSELWAPRMAVTARTDDERTVLELLERGVWVHPGYFFGMAESGWLVVSLLAPEEEFTAGVKEMVAHFSQLEVK